MKRKHLDCLAAIAFGAIIGVATPALAFGGGMHGGFGGMHGGFGGMHGGFGGMRGGVSGAHVGGPGLVGGVHGGMTAGRAAFTPMGHRFGGGQFRFHNHHRHFRNVVIVGAPFAVYGGGYDYDDGCWRQVWTTYGWQWVYLC